MPIKLLELAGDGAEPTDSKPQPLSQDTLSGPRGATCPGLQVSEPNFRE
jgi:hypothetical protein